MARCSTGRFGGEMGRHGLAGGSAGRAAGVQMAAATPYGRRTCEPNNACPHACSLCGALCLATCAGRALLRALRDPSGRGPRCHRTDVPLDRCRNRCFRTCTPALDDCRPASACCRPAAVTPAILLLFSEYRWGRINLRPRSHGLGIFNILYGGAGGGKYSASDEYIRVSVASWSVEVIRM